MNKKDIKYVVISCACYAAIGGLSYFIGKRVAAQIFNDRLDYMARTGATISNIVDGKEYVCSVTEKI